MASHPGGAYLLPNTDTCHRIVHRPRPIPQTASANRGWLSRLCSEQLTGGFRDETAIRVKLSQSSNRQATSVR
jgi:hypothetical protein